MRSRCDGYHCASRPPGWGLCGHGVPCAEPDALRQQRAHTPGARAAEALNYEPNVLSRGLRSRQTRAIGLILPDVANPFFAEVTKAVEAECAELGYQVFICQSDEALDKELALVSLLQSRLVDGLLITPSAGDHTFLKSVLRKPLPIVFLSRYIRGLPIPAVVIDNQARAFLGVSHLIEAGREKIAAVLGRKGLSVTADRLRGYRKALKAAGLRLEGRWVIEGALPFAGHGRRRLPVIPLEHIPMRRLPRGAIMMTHASSCAATRST